MKSIAFILKKLPILSLLLVFVTLKGNAQTNNQISDEPFAYQVNGIIPVQKFNNDYERPIGQKLQLGNYRYDLVGKYKIQSDGLTIEYVLLRIQRFKYKTAPLYFQKKTDSVYLIPRKKYKNRKKIGAKYITKTPSIVDVEDQEDVYVIENTVFQENLNEGFIRKQYYTNKHHFDWGGSMTIPFKIRPSINDINMKITPELSLGGFFGLRKRINKYKPHYWYLPVITAGVTVIGVNQDNIIVEQDTDGVKDGLVFARTLSIGSIIKLDNFQMGFVLGWDKPGGEIAKDWIYNDRLWYSFTIGFDFLSRKDD